MVKWHFRGQETSISHGLNANQMSNAIRESNNQYGLGKDFVIPSTP